LFSPAPAVIATEKTDLLFRKLMQKQEGLVRARRSCTLRDMDSGDGMI
jgi:hypothetical protein